LAAQLEEREAANCFPFFLRTMPLRLTGRRIENRQSLVYNSAGKRRLP